jgi:hypothetical protein
MDLPDGARRFFTWGVFWGSFWSVVSILTPSMSKSQPSRTAPNFAFSGIGGFTSIL